MTNLREWWNGLTDAQRDRLMDDPEGPVPSDLIGQSDGPAAVAAYWPEVEQGPAGFYFDWKTQQFIEIRSRLRTYHRLVDEHRELHERHFPVSQGLPVVYGDPLEEDTFDRLDDLHAQVAKARTDYRTAMIQARG